MYQKGDKVFLGPIEHQLLANKNTLFDLQRWEIFLRLLTTNIVRTKLEAQDIELYLIVTVRLSGILKAKLKLGVTFNVDQQDVIVFTNFSKMTMCMASEANS